MNATLPSLAPYGQGSHCRLAGHVIGGDDAPTSRRIVERRTERIFARSAFRIAHALEAGAEGALLKSTANTNILKAVKTVANGEKAIAREIEEFFVKEPPVPELTERQRIILESITEGLTNKAIADRLGISEDGVKRHLNALFPKLGVESRAEAVAIALRRHLLKT